MVYVNDYLKSLRDKFYLNVNLITKLMGTKKKVTYDWLSGNRKFTNVLTHHLLLQLHDHYTKKILELEKILDSCSFQENKKD